MPLSKGNLPVCCACVCVCVCVSERERESVCVFVCVCVSHQRPDLGESAVLGDSCCLRVGVSIVGVATWYVACVCERVRVSVCYCVYVMKYV